MRSGRHACTCAAVSIGNAHCRPAPEIARKRWSDARLRQRFALIRVHRIVEGRERAFARDLPDMGMIDDDQIVARRKLLDRIRLEVLQRALLPNDLYARLV